MADKSMEHDKKVLHNLGYAQELARRMSGFSNFAISFSIICILAGGISAFYAAFNSTGGGGAFIGWLVGSSIAFLYAPMTGDALRSTLRQRGETLVSSVSRLSVRADDDDVQDDEELQMEQHKLSAGFRDFRPAHGKELFSSNHARSVHQQL